MPGTITLSESAILTLRFEVNGWKARRPDRRAAAYRELTEAGIMELDGAGGYCFTAWGMTNREAILAIEAERIERERLKPPDRDLSPAARERLRLHLAGDRAVTEENRPAYRELVSARVMLPVHTFTGGREAAYTLTYWGRELATDLIAGDRATA